MNDQLELLEKQLQVLKDSIVKWRASVVALNEAIDRAELSVIQVEELIENGVH